MIDETTLGFADFGGNRQYISLGNLSENDRAQIFLMDYANRRRVKIWGPVVRGTTEYRFLLRAAIGHRFGWRLDARVEGSEAPYRHVAAGYLRTGLEPRRGIGGAGIDLNALGWVDPTVTARRP